MAANAANAATTAQNTAEDAARAAQSAGGLYPQIIVFVAAGAVVTYTDGVRNIGKTADNAPVVFDVPDYGEWTVSILRDDLPSDSVTVIVDTAKQYPIALAFLTSTITVMVETGSTVVCEGGGRTQTKISDGSVVFTVTSATTYSITATTGEERSSGTVEITASEQAKLITLEYFRSTITVNVAEGAYVTCTDGTATLDGNSTGSVVFEVHNAAAWQIAASMNGRTVTGTATITVNVEAGSTVTCTKGAATQTETSAGSVVFTVEEAGIYAITAAKNGQMENETVQLTASGQSKTVSIVSYDHTFPQRYKAPKGNETQIPLPQPVEN